MQGFYGSVEHAKFYAAGVVCALEHMHERRIIHRDIKPENILLNEKGHLKAWGGPWRFVEQEWRGGLVQCRVDRTAELRDHWDDGSQ